MLRASYITTSFACDELKIFMENLFDISIHCKNARVIFTLTHCDMHKNTHSHMRVIYCCVMVTHCLRVTLHLHEWLKSCKRF